MLSLLLVDDDAADREMIKKSLKSLHASFTEANTAAEAMKTLDNNFDLVVLDYQLPDLNGLELAEKIRKARPYVPIILVTGHGSEELAIDTAQAGILDYVPKSTISSEFLTRVVLQALALHASKLEKLQALEDYERLYNSSPIGLFALNHNFHFSRYNPFCAKVFGSESYKSAHDVFPNWSEIIAAGCKIKEVAILLNNQNWVSLTLESTPEGYDGYLLDITDKKQIEREIETIMLEQMKTLAEVQNSIKARIQDYLKDEPAKKPSHWLDFLKKFF